MGLDMYLKKHTNVKNWEILTTEPHYEVDVKCNGEPLHHVKRSRISGIIEEVGYWRKANHIHNWFVENCQEGVDDCEESYIPRVKLLELKAECENMIRYLDTCTKKETEVETGFRYVDGERDSIYSNVMIFEIDETKITLPTTKGFFFGSTEYGQCYYDDIKDTIDIINNALEGVSTYDEVEFYYQSSW